MALRTAGSLAAGLAITALMLGGLAGCGGSSGSGTGGDSISPSETDGATGTTATEGRYAIEQQAQSRGIKGESPTAEAETALRIAGEDCTALAASVEERLGARLDHRSDPSPPLSKCRISGAGVAISVFLDSAFAAHQRYMNRIEETQQFGAPDPGKIPHPVAGVGEKAAYNQDANWVPDYGTLFAVRGNRYLTIAYSAKGQDNRESRDEAAALGRLAFHLTAR